MIWISNLQFDDNCFNYYSALDLHMLSNLPIDMSSSVGNSRSCSHDGGDLVEDGGSSSNVGGDTMVVTTQPPPRLRLWMPASLECDRNCLLYTSDAADE